MYEWVDHNSVRATEIYVEDGPQKEAMKRLHERMDAGESPYEILGISEDHKYYVDKIVNGYMRLSYCLYGRIMQLDEDDAFDV